MPIRTQNQQQQVARSMAMPGPVGGWNSRDAIDQMDPRDAIRMKNIFPGTNQAKLRKGYAQHATTASTTALDVETLANFNDKTGTEKLIAFADGNIWDATAATLASTLASGMTNNRWSYVMFNQKLIACNGADTPMQYDGTTASTITGLQADTQTTVDGFIHVNAFKSRLFFVEADSLSFWYGGTNSITGSVTEEFDLQYLSTEGGKLLWTASWGLDSGTGLQTVFTAMTDQGEAFVYDGNDPGDASNWSLVGRFVIPRPLSRRSYINLGTELVVNTEQGMIPLSQVIYKGRAIGTYETLTDKIKNEFGKVAELYRDNFGWEIYNFPIPNWLLINVPTSPSNDYRQYVMNTLTGAWCEFRDLPAVSWVKHNDKIYFGSIDGKIYEANTGSTDNGNPITVDLKQAFSYLPTDGARNDQLLKLFQMIRPIIESQGSIGFDLGIDVDFEDTATTQSIMADVGAGAEWDVGEWDVAEWSDGMESSKEWYSVAGLGRAVSPKLGGQFSNTSFAISSWNITYIPGGIV